MDGDGVRKDVLIKSLLQELATHDVIADSRLYALQHNLSHDEVIGALNSMAAAELVTLANLYVS